MLQNSASLFNRYLWLVMESSVSSRSVAGTHFFFFFFCFNSVPSSVFPQNSKQNSDTHLHRPWQGWVNAVYLQCRNLGSYQLWCSFSNTHGFNSLNHCTARFICVYSGPTFLTLYHPPLFKIDTIPVHYDFSPTISESDQCLLVLVVWEHACLCRHSLDLWYNSLVPVCAVSMQLLL